jgi:hypothetical protein
LNVILLEHNLFKDLGKRIAARVCRVPLGFHDWYRVRVKKMSDRSIASNQDYPLEFLAGTTLFEKPVQALHRNIDDIVGGLLASGQVQDMCDVPDRLPDYYSI